MEITTALQTVPLHKLVFVFPYLLQKAKRTLWQRFAENRQKALGRTTLTVLQDERNERYAAFRNQFGRLLGADLPLSLNAGIFSTSHKPGTLACFLCASPS